MISKRVVLVGCAAIGVSYVLAVENVSRREASASLGDAAEPDTSLQPLRTATPAAADPRTQRELAELSSGVTQLRTELSALRAHTQPARAQEAPAEPAPKTEEQVQREHDQYMAEVERSFEREARDEPWAKSTRQLLRQTVEAEPVMLAALRGIDCRSSSCRMEIHDDGSAAFGESFPSLLHHLGAILPEVRFDHAELANGAQLHTLYMSTATGD